MRTNHSGLQWSGDLEQSQFLLPLTNLYHLTFLIFLFMQVLGFFLARLLQLYRYILLNSQSMMDMFKIFFQHRSRNVNILLVP